MTDLNKPIQPIRPSEDGWKRVQRIEGYKQRGRQDPPPDDDPTKPIFFALFVTLFKKLISYKEKKSRLLINTKEIIKDLSAFYDALQELINEDRSHDPAFTQTLSLLWHNLVEDCNQLEDALGGNHPSSLKFKLLLDEIDMYPPWEEHSLGFYLTRRAGETWLPLPFMQTLLAPHISAKKNPLQNPLEKWCHLSSDIKESI